MQWAIHERVKMTIVFGLLLVILNFYLCLSVPDKNKNIPKIICNVDHQFHSPFITALVEQEADITGCHSRDTTTGSQEVHIVNLLSSGTNDGVKNREGYLPSVSIDVLPHKKRKSFSNATVIILHSVMPVMWQMNLKRVSDGTKFSVFVNKPSHVVPSSAVFVSRQKFPPLRRFPAWIKNNYGAVTSFATISVANDISLFLGADANAPQGCNFHGKNEAVSVKASYIQPQPTTGCYLNNSRNVGMMYDAVHVVELNSSASSDTVLIYLRSPEELQNSQATQDLVLILKCYKPTEWIIDGSGIQGFLYVVSEYPVHFRTNPMYIMAKLQEKVLPSGSVALLNTAQSMFGSVDSFLRANKANRINIVLKEPNTRNNIQENKSDKSLPESPLKGDQFSDELYVVDQEKSKVQESGPNALKEREMIQLLAKQMITECFMDKIRVTLLFDEAMDTLIPVIDSHSKLTSIALFDPECKAERNESHIILHTHWNTCGTLSSMTTDDLIFHNQVQFITTNHNHVKRTSSSGQKHLPTDDDDYVSEEGSGSSGLQMANEKHATEKIIYPIPFECPKTIFEENNGTNDINFELNIFRKKDFQHPILEHLLPFDVTVHSHLFAKASISADPRLCIGADECWLSDDDGFTKKSSTKSVLIKQGCPTDLSVEMLSNSHCGPKSSDVEHHSLKFSFQLGEEFVDQYLYLHCRFTSCAIQDSQQLNVKQCINTEDFCLKHSLRPYLDSLRGKKFRIVTYGPFHIIAKKEVQKKKEGLLSYSDPVKPSTPPDNFAVDYSFDKFTGNSKKQQVSQQLVLIGLSTEAVVGIAFASFIIGAGLMATLWLIHIRTEPSRQVKHCRKHSTTHYRTERKYSFSHAEIESPVPCSLKPISVRLCS